MPVPVWMSLLSDSELTALMVCLRVTWHEHPLPPDQSGAVETLIEQTAEEYRNRQRVCEALARQP